MRLLSNILVAILRIGLTATSTTSAATNATTGAIDTPTGTSKHLKRKFGRGRCILSSYSQLLCELLRGFMVPALTLQLQSCLQDLAKFDGVEFLDAFAHEVDVSRTGFHARHQNQHLPTGMPSLFQWCQRRYTHVMVQHAVVQWGWTDGAAYMPSKESCHDRANAIPDQGCVARKSTHGGGGCD